MILIRSMCSVYKLHVLRSSLYQLSIESSKILVSFEFQCFKINKISIIDGMRTQKIAKNYLACAQFCSQ